MCRMIVERPDVCKTRISIRVASQDARERFFRGKSVAGGTGIAFDPTEIASRSENEETSKLRMIICIFKE